MVAAGQFDGAWRSGGGEEEVGAQFAVGAAAGKCAAHLELGGLGGSESAKGDPASHHVRDAIAGALGALAGIVQKGGDEEVVVTFVATLDEPAGGAGGMALIARLLGGEEGKQVTGQILAGEGKVGGGRGQGGFADLADAVEHQVMIPRKASAAWSNIQRIGLYSGAIKPRRRSAMRSAGPQRLREARGWES